jgi:hypothetical protein
MMRQDRDGALLPPGVITEICPFSSSARDSVMLVPLTLRRALAMSVATNHGAPSIVRERMSCAP